MTSSLHARVSSRISSLSASTVVAALVALMAFTMVSATLTSCAASDTGSRTPVTSSDQKEAAASDMTVTVSVESSAADGSVSAETSVSLPEGASAYDALMACGLDVVSESSQYGQYVSAIDGLAAGDHGDMSGWMFSVNGEAGQEACDKCKLQDGDTVLWSYSV